MAARMLEKTASKAENCSTRRPKNAILQIPESKDDLEFGVPLRASKAAAAAAAAASASSVPVACAPWKNCNPWKMGVRRQPRSGLEEPCGRPPRTARFVSFPNDRYIRDSCRTPSPPRERAAVKKQRREQLSPAKTSPRKAKPTPPVAVSGLPEEPKASWQQPWLLVRCRLTGLAFPRTAESVRSPRESQVHALADFVPHSRCSANTPHEATSTSPSKTTSTLSFASPAPSSAMQPAASSSLSSSSPISPARQHLPPSYAAASSKTSLPPSTPNAVARPSPPSGGGGRLKANGGLVPKLSSSSSSSSFFKRPPLTDTEAALFAAAPAMAEVQTPLKLTSALRTDQTLYSLRV
eukprot:TRINITY_DN83763_c0_g1_i1.p1 TRINITY_DN83763_c0_g1~~TRINITY_DN83763_c0_g1_i1.p1  ORF type:complete len:352 (-),score=60.23 TRINITY_DN83763_c0_g1_i1:85-1140(-)